jgi:hypothetical protein
MNRKKFMLGKLPPKIDKRTLDLAPYVQSQKLDRIVPNRIDWRLTQSNWGMMRNDRVGCCTVAAAAHMIQAWTLNASEIQTVSDDEVIRVYSAISGYDPTMPDTDRGAYMLDLLKYWQRYDIGGHRIRAYATVKPTHDAMVRAAIWLFGGLYAGFALPITAQRQDVWSVESLVGDGRPGSWGGHTISQIQIDGDGQYCVTWGRNQRMTTGFLHAYCDELYAVVADDWLTEDGVTVGGFAPSELLQDVAKVTA